MSGHGEAVTATHPPRLTAQLLKPSLYLSTYDTMPHGVTPALGSRSSILREHSIYESRIMIP